MDDSYSTDVFYTPTFLFFKINQNTEIVLVYKCLYCSFIMNVALCIVQGYRFEHPHTEHSYCVLNNYDVHALHVYKQLLHQMHFRNSLLDRTRTYIQYIRTCATRSSARFNRSWSSKSSTEGSRRRESCMETMYPHIIMVFTTYMLSLIELLLW